MYAQRIFHDESGPQQPKQWAKALWCLVLNEDRANHVPLPKDFHIQLFLCCARALQTTFVPPAQPTHFISPGWAPSVCSPDLNPAKNHIRCWA